MLLKIQMVINTSLTPIRIVKMFAEGLSRCKILPTISSCLGTRFSILQKSPFTSQTVAVSMSRILFVRLLFITCKVCVALAGKGMLAVRLFVVIIFNFVFYHLRYMSLSVLSKEIDVFININFSKSVNRHGCFI